MTWTNHSQADRRNAAPHPLACTPQENEALNFLVPLSEDYPGIDRWFLGKVLPGLRLGTRTLLRIERHGQLAALGIGKIEDGERKICTVRVSPAYYGRGLGIRVFDGLLKWLNVDRPHLTVSATKLPSFERIFDVYGFKLTSVHDGLYVPSSCELAYNELLRKPLDNSALGAVISEISDEAV